MIEVVGQVAVAAVSLFGAGTAVSAWGISRGWWRFDRLEFVTVAVAASFVVGPLLLSVEWLIIGGISWWLPLLNVGLLWTVVITGKGKVQILSTSLDTRNTRNVLVGAVFVFAAVAASIVSAYQALPDVDPYHWLKAYEQWQAGAGGHSLPYRSLFYFVVFVFERTGGIDSYVVFKYVLPLLWLIVMLPLGLLARRLTGLAAIAVYALPVASPSLLLSLHLPVPHTFALILAIYTVVFLVYSALPGKGAFYWLAGALAAVAFLYHEVGLIFLLAWVAVTLGRRQFIDHVRVHIVIAVAGVTVAAAAIMLYARTALDNVVYIFGQAARDIRFNLRFPAAFTNIDGLTITWASWGGLATYYLFYVGPVTLALVGIGLWLMARPRARADLVRVFHQRGWLVSAVAAVIFIFIAEILPRVLNIALLPDRAWMFAAIFLLGFVVWLIERKNVRPVFVPVLLCLAAVSIGGALHINYQKQYVITDQQVAGARWFGDQVAGSSLLITDKYFDLLNYFARTNFQEVPRAFFCAPVISVETFKDSLPAARPGQDRYVFWYKDDPRNPYRGRASWPTSAGSCYPRVLERYPTHFEKLYDDAGEVVIWKVL